MDFSKFRAYLPLLLVMLPMLAATEDSIPPVLAPYFGTSLFDNICNDVDCGKGSCEQAPGKPFNFICNCERGWKRTHHDNDDDEDDLQFLPCIVPKCSVDYSCLPAPPPAPPIPHNTSFFDPCYWIYCGEGTCKKNITHGQTCECEYGYSNLLGIPAFPCFNDCAIGSDCQKQGIRLSNSTASSPSSIFNTNNGGDDNNGATTFMPKNSHWMAILLASAAMALLN
ncbi:uncharacterized protein LOC132063618 isoform X1 [Lycium ferocissimum]|uniref:uncharacterized protein LOC132063618 isoform X1 n=1 Tax=Lycium ferocissimum TaxID=112874 RepID=UPI00281679A8|nr:uncharacterized protein LOC132063618 isoform X1 [Lycium ferocissimum]